MGERASRQWLADRGLMASAPYWYVEIQLGTRSAHPTTTFDLAIYPEEWSVAFRHDRRSSWIRVTDAPFVHVRDDFELLADLPDLARIGDLISLLERRHHVTFDRPRTSVHSDLRRAAPIVRAWLGSL